MDWSPEMLSSLNTSGKLSRAVSPREGESLQHRLCLVLRLGELPPGVGIRHDSSPRPHPQPPPPPPPDLPPPGGPGGRGPYQGSGPPSRCPRPRPHTGRGPRV